MTRIEVELHKKTGRHGPFMMGNIRIPAQLDMDNLVLFLYADEGDKQEFPDNAKIYIEACRDARGVEDEHGNQKIARRAV